ncbi:AraC family transcriptional regulator [Bacteroides reticulotermitis]|uniref:Transcriptional regulator n=2 Tax=Bacteroides reticulotermitis TaxID=1133319 RepID=W4UXE5_9BACE|nr:AraC family transcriptional regulator [Bacteroides reticulotermitis]MBB4042307.1 AraC-like DNA-binding protein [Bacteroides reticulotermitis]GAE85179.1 transcriptional regulator [Bacteroides reticulotermitis JCM 10512]
MQSFEIIKPTPALSSYIRYYWILRDDALRAVTERTLPVGCIQLVFHRGQRLFMQNERMLQPSSFISGQFIGYADVVSTGRLEMIVVVFQPQAAKTFLRIPSRLFYGQHISTDDVGDIELTDLAKQVADTPECELCIRLIEEFLFRRLHALTDFHLKRITAVLHEIDSRPQIQLLQLADVACLSSKQLGRVFADYIGATPKEFIRIVRMQRALSILQRDANISFAQIAYECGFADQSHMIKEFKLFSGYTPAEYLSACAPYSDYFSDY